MHLREIWLAGDHVSYLNSDCQSSSSSSEEEDEAVCSYDVMWMTGLNSNTTQETNLLFEGGSNRRESWNASFKCVDSNLFATVIIR